MGKREHDSDAFNTAHSAAASSGSTFDWSANARTSGQCHPALNPGYGGYRYSYDLPDMLTESISVIFDVTGSNQEAARKVWTELPTLFDLIYGQDWLKGKNFNMQVGATGDAYWDKIPMQLSQFERDGVTIDQWLQSIVLEGGGGGGGQESYELMMYLLTHQNKLDAWKRGGTGLVYMIFDEAPYGAVSAEQLHDLYRVSPLKESDLKDVDVELGSRMRARTVDEAGFVLPKDDVPLETIVKDFRSKYEVFCIICGESSYYHTESTLPLWRKLFGEEHVVKLPDASTIVQLISSMTAVLRGGVSKARVIKELEMLPGSNPGRVDAISKALTLATGNGSANSVNLPVKTNNPNKGITRL